MKRNNQIKLTESELQEVIEESVRILLENEYDEGTGWNFLKNLGSEIKQGAKNIWNTLGAAYKGQLQPQQQQAQQQGANTNDSSQGQSNTGNVQSQQPEVQGGGEQQSAQQDSNSEPLTGVNPNQEIPKAAPKKQAAQGGNNQAKPQGAQNNNQAQPQVAQNNNQAQQNNNNGNVVAPKLEVTQNRMEIARRQNVVQQLNKISQNYPDAAQYIQPLIQSFQNSVYQWYKQQ